MDDLAQCRWPVTVDSLAWQSLLRPAYVMADWDGGQKAITVSAGGPVGVIAADGLHNLGHFVVQHIDVSRYLI
jgi:hypothetical protein